MVYDESTKIPQLWADDKQIAKVFVGEDLVYQSESMYLVLNTDGNGSSGTRFTGVTFGGVSIFDNAKNVLNFASQVIAFRYQLSSYATQENIVIVDGTQVYRQYHNKLGSDETAYYATDSFTWTPTAHKYNVTFTNVYGSYSETIVNTVTITEV